MPIPAVETAPLPMPIPAPSRPVATPLPSPLPFPAPTAPVPAATREPIAAAAFQQPKLVLPKPRTAVDDGPEYNVPTELPDRQKLFRRDSEADFFQRIVQDRRREFGNRAIFPDPVVLTKEPFRARDFPVMVELVEPCYVHHRRLLFEQPNFERAGYNFGMLQPAICLGVFYYDLALLPYHAASDLRGLGETSVGKCLPGDPSPLLFPIERFSVSGLVGQAAVVTGGAFLLK